MNQLHVGFSKSIDLPKGGYLLIDDEVRDIPRSRVFDPLKHSFNPLKGIEYKRARELAEFFYTISPQGDNTVRSGKQAMLRALVKADRLDHVECWDYARPMRAAPHHPNWGAAFGMEERRPTSEKALRIVTELQNKYDCSWPK
jgi:hypothetical protein